MRQDSITYEVLRSGEGCKEPYICRKTQRRGREICGALGFSGFGRAVPKRIDQAFLFEGGFGGRARSEPFPSRLFHQMEGCDRRKGDHHEVRNDDRQTHPKPGMAPKPALSPRSVKPIDGRSGHVAV
jgi:hypothetical protein